MKKVALKRELGLLEITLSGVGIILGAGIYALIGKAAGLAGNSVWLSFVLSAIVAVFTGLSYAELSSMFPKAGAEYEYVMNAFGRRFAFIIGWLIIWSGVTGASTVALGFGGYFNALFGVPVITGALLLLVSLSFILFYGIKESARFAIAATLIEAGGLVFIIFIGLPYLGDVDYFKMPLGLKGVFEASALIFFAYIGFEGIVKLSEETKAPEKTIPKGLMLAILISIVLYILVAVSAVSVMGWEKLSSSDAPFADLAYRVLGNKAFVVLSVIALFATANTVLMMQLASSRITYGMADSFSLPGLLATLHPSRRTPWVAILSMTGLSMVFIFAGNIGFVANITNFTLFVTFIVINAALIFLRYREPSLKRPFRVPLTVGKFPILPLFGLAFCIFLLFQLNLEVLAIGAVLTLLGGLFSLVNVQKTNRRLTHMNADTLMQKQK